MVTEPDGMRTDIRASLRIVNYSCSHDAVTAAFGVEPSETWNVGHPLKSGRRPHKSKGWRVWSSRPMTATARPRSQDDGQAAGDESRPRYRLLRHLLIATAVRVGRGDTRLAPPPSPCSWRRENFPGKAGRASRLE